MTEKAAAKVRARIRVASGWRDARAQTETIPGAVGNGSPEVVEPEYPSTAELSQDGSTLTIAAGAPGVLHPFGKRGPRVVIGRIERRKR